MQSDAANTQWLPSNTTRIVIMFLSPDIVYYIICYWVFGCIFFHLTTTESTDCTKRETVSLPEWFQIASRVGNKFPLHSSLPSSTNGLKISSKFYLKYVAWPYCICLCALPHLLTAVDSLYQGCGQ